MSRSGALPMVMTSPVSSVSAYSHTPGPSRNCRTSANMRSPVHEGDQDVRAQCPEQRDAERHVHVQPQPQPAGQANVATDAPQDHLTAAQYGDQRLQDCGLGALVGPRQTIGDEVDGGLL